MGRILRAQQAGIGGKAGSRTLTAEQAMDGDTVGLGDGIEQSNLNTTAYGVIPHVISCVLPDHPLEGVAPEAAFTYTGNAVGEMHLVDLFETTPLVGELAILMALRYGFEGQVDKNLLDTLDRHVRVADDGGRGHSCRKT